MKKKLRLYPVFTILLFLLLPSLQAEESGESVLTYSADTIHFSRKKSTISLFGQCKLQYGSMTLFADTVIYNRKQQNFSATGSPVLIDEGDTLRGVSLFYDLTKKSGRVRRARYTETEENILYSGTDIVRDSANTIYIREGDYTTSFIRPRQYSLFSDKFKLIHKDKAISRPLVLIVQKTPILTLPYFIIPLKEKEDAGWLTPRWGVGINGSGYIDNLGYYWGQNPYVDLYLAGRVNNFEKFQLKGETRYRVTGKLSGSVYSDITLNDSYLSRSNRWSLKFNHDQNLLPDNSLKISGSGNFVSDNRYFTDYHRDTGDVLNQDLNSRLSITRQFDSIGAYARLNWERRENLSKKRTSQTLPGFRFNINNRRLIPLQKYQDSTAWYNEIQYSYNLQALRKTRQSDADTNRFFSAESGAHHRIPVNARFTLFNHLDITPYFHVDQSIVSTYFDTASKKTVDTFETKMDTVTVREYLTDSSLHSDGDSLITINDTSYYICNFRDSAYTFTRYDTVTAADPAYDPQKALNTWWTTGVDLQTQLYGIFPLGPKNRAALRHTFRPSLGYSFDPEIRSSHRYAGVVSTPTVRDQRQNMNFSLGNDLDLKTGNHTESPKKTPLISTVLSGSYNFEADTNALSDLSLSADIPSNFVSLNYSGTYHPYTADNKLIIPRPLRHSISVTPSVPALRGSIWSGDLFTYNESTFPTYLGGLYTTGTDWRLSIRPSYRMSLQRSSLQESFKKDHHYTFSSNAQLRFSHRWRMTWGGTWSFKENTFINQSISLYGDLNSWDFNLSWNPTGINSGQVNMVIAVKRHREIKWDHNRM
ncbi:MAG: putative LPS assembly protein LptD [Fibrobacterota bacterium]